MNHSYKHRLIDIGANLTHESFAHDLPEVLCRARENGVDIIVVTGTDLDSSRAAIALASAHDGLYATVGWHPHHAELFNTAAGTELCQLQESPAVKAIGEIGMDFYRNYSSPVIQEKVFELLLNLAVQSGLPVFAHERDAFERVYPILCNRHKELSKVVIHCFTGNKKSLRSYLDLGLYIGITGWICDERRGSLLKELVRYVPNNRLMIETDAPYLLPRDLSKSQVHVKHRNEPAYLPHILSTIAQCLGCDTGTLARQTRRTSMDFFGF
jgi:TatD DNase family protein